MKAVTLCTCTDHACPAHPLNHDQGCTPCVAKNLTEGEIPSCFFRLVRDDLGDRADFSIEGFAKLVADEKHSLLSCPKTVC